MPSLVGLLRVALRGSARAAAPLLVTALGALGCASSDSVPGGNVPSELADECYWGYQFADCGGTGTPRFACAPVGFDCAWFTGGVVSEGYLAWPCADGRICCEDGPNASYPREPSTYPAAFFSSNGAEPWTRDRSLVLDVSVDASLSGGISVVCEREGDGVDDVAPCRDPNASPNGVEDRYHVVKRMRDTLTVAVQQADGLGSTGLLVEIMPGSSPETTLARACLQVQTDSVEISCDPDTYRAMECATEGSIHLSEIPARNATDLDGVVVSGDVVFPSGLEISFTVPL